MGPATSAWRDPYGHWSERYPGRRAMGYLCTYVPEEIIHAAGFTPIRLAPSVDPPLRADVHLQNYTCCLARSCLDQALAGRLDWLQGVIFAHTCDTMQGLADIWRECFPHQFVETIVTPVTLSGPYAKKYLMAELEQFRQRLGQFAGHSISDEALRSSIRLYNARRRALAAFYARREEYTAVEWFSIMNAALVTPPEEGVIADSGLGTRNCELGIVNSAPSPGLSQFAIPNSQSAIRNPPFAIRLVLVGSTLDEPTLPLILDELGAKVVADDFCNGARYFDRLVDETLPPLEALAERELTRALCPCKHRGLEERIDDILSLVEQHHADGVILYHKKFCDPHAWDAVPLAAALDRTMVPLLSLETEQVAPLGQTRVRVEAFLEMLGV